MPASHLRLVADALDELPEEFVEDVLRDFQADAQAAGAAAAPWPPGVAAVRVEVSGGGGSATGTAAPSAAARGKWTVAEKGIKPHQIPKVGRKIKGRGMPINGGYARSANHPGVLPGKQAWTKTVEASANSIRAEWERRVREALS